MSEQRGAAIGRMVQEKQTSYGSAYPRVARALKALLEVEGVDAGTPLKLSEAQLRELPYITRLLEKAARVLHGGPHALGEDAWEDVAGIALARLAEQERADEAWVKANVQPTKESPRLFKRDGGARWLHAWTSEHRVACLPNIDAPEDWPRVANRQYFDTTYGGLASIADRRAEGVCSHCIEALNGVGPGEKPAPPVAAASPSRG